MGPSLSVRLLFCFLIVLHFLWPSFEVVVIQYEILMNSFRDLTFVIWRGSFSSFRYLQLQEMIYWQNRITATVNKKQCLVCRGMNRISKSEGDWQWHLPTVNTLFLNIFLSWHIFLHSEVKSCEVKLEPLSVTTVRRGPWYRMTLFHKCHGCCQCRGVDKGTNSTHLVK